MKKYIAIFFCGLTILSGCSSMNQTTKGGLIGSGAGAAVGAALGTLIGKDAKGAAIGTAIGTAIGGTAGVLIGKKMDQKAEELAALENAQVETTTDANGLEAIKVTFDSGILFEFNKSNLSAAAKNSLTEFAKTMSDMKETDITIWGHTDNVGSAEANEKVSLDRANAVKTFLMAQGIADGRMTAEGKSYTLPVATNDTAEGRQLNRRVEVYITANANMIKQAEDGNL